MRYFKHFVSAIDRKLIYVGLSLVSKLYTFTDIELNIEWNHFKINCYLFIQGYFFYNQITLQFYNFITLNRKYILFSID